MRYIWRRLSVSDPVPDCFFLVFIIRALFPFAAINPPVIENRLYDLNKDLNRLLAMAGSEILNLRIKQISDEYFS